MALNLTDDARGETTIMWKDALWLNAHPEGINPEVTH